MGYLKIPKTSPNQSMKQGFELDDLPSVEAMMTMERDVVD